jgi:Flp pilus assembly pilin Flp
MSFALWKIRSGLQTLFQREEGQDLVEYALVISLIATATVASLKAFSTTLVGYYQSIIANYP